MDCDVRNFDAHTIAVLKRLPRLLAREGYTDAYTIYGPLNTRRSHWQNDLRLLPDNLRTLFKLFLLGIEVSRESLSEVLTESEIEALMGLSILLPGSTGYHSGNLALIPAYGYLIFAQRPTVNPMVYFGDDSAALAAHLMPSRGDFCLDLCAGPGTQSLICGGQGSRVVAVEVNPLAASHAELNVVMNNLEDKVEVRIGNLYEAVPGLQFDYICANPPLLPFPPLLPYPFVGHGGADGLDITRRILKGLSIALKPNGICQIIGSCLGNDVGPLCEEELQALAVQYSWKMSMTIPSAIPLEPPSPMFDGLVWTCAASAGLPLDQVMDQFRSHLEEMGATHLNLFFLVVSKSETPSFSLTRHYRERRGFWFVTE